MGNQLQMNVQLALAADPKTRASISHRPYFAGGKQFSGADGPSDKAQLAPFFVQTLGKEDMRPADGVGPRHLDR